MNNVVTVNIDPRFEADVLRILRAIPGLEVDRGPLDLAVDSDIDAVVVSAGHETPILIETKARVNAATARQLVRVAQLRPDTPLLLVAGETTAEARCIVAENGIGCIDGLGNAHLELPGLLLHIGGTNKPAPKTSTRLSGKAGIVAQALLREPGHPWQIKDLAAATGVSAGFVHRVVARLTNEALLTADGSGPQRTRTVSDPAGLLDLWVEEQDDKTIRNHAYQLAQTNQQLVADLTRALDAADIEYAVTGAAAAAMIAPVLTTVAVTELWVDARTDPRDLIEQTPAEAVDAGHNVVFLQTKSNAPLEHRQRVHDVWITGSIRLYLDLRNDPRRGAEQADNLREQIIGF